VIGRAFVLVALTGCAPSTDWEYVRCASDAECSGPARCAPVTWRDGSGSMCTIGCAAPSECARAGHCVDVARDGTFRCYEPCLVDADCGTGFVCQPLTTGSSVCLPQ
jgi:hypothetical protein